MNTITLENIADVDQVVDVRFVLDGDVVHEERISVPGGERMNVSHSETLTEPGEYEFAANVGLSTDEESYVRSFDFDIGWTELDDGGHPVAVQQADSSDDPGSSPVPWTIVGIFAIVVGGASVVGVWVWRRNERSPPRNAY